MTNFLVNLLKKYLGEYLEKYVTKELLDQLWAELLGWVLANAEDVLLYLDEQAKKTDTPFDDAVVDLLQEALDRLQDNSK